MSKIEPSLRRELEWALGIFSTYGKLEPRETTQFHAAMQANSPILAHRFSRLMDNARPFQDMPKEDMLRVGTLLLALEARAKGERWHLYQPGEFDEEGDPWPDARKTAHIQIRCTETWKLKLRAYCERSGLDASTLIRNAVEAHLADNPLWKGTPAPPEEE